MKLIVGLGNPGPEYLFTRHNFGFMVIDFLMQEIEGHIKFIKDREVYGEWARIFINNKELFLLKPSTFMNLSGVSVKAFLDKYSISTSDLLVIYDDVDLPLGKIRLRKKGSSGGHKGMNSIIENLDTKEFARLRLGIGPKPSHLNMADFVLGEFTEEELVIVKDVLKRCKELIFTILDEGIDIAMSRFNG